MKRLCWTLIVLALCIVGVGFSRGWFALSSSRYDDGHKVNVNLTVDEDKMKQDGETLKEKTRELTGNAMEETKNFVNPSGDAALRKNE